jgi:hypothetical protein
MMQLVGGYKTIGLPRQAQDGEHSNDEIIMLTQNPGRVRDVQVGGRADG